MEQEKVYKKPSILLALLPILFLIGCLYVAVYLFGQAPHIPILVSACVAVAVGAYLGYSWEEMEKSIISTISMSMQACLILMTVGILISTWIACGTVPAMIYYGLTMINPSIFLATACLICSIVSLATGSSWSTASTIGIALMGIGAGLNIPAPMTAGAIISGAYFGDKMSPLSDTTNLAPAMAGSNLFDHIKHMVFTTGPSWVLAMVLFAIVGSGHGKEGLDMVQINGIKDAITSIFNINILLLIPPITVIAMVVLKIPALPGLWAGSFLGALFIFIFQMDSYDGFVNCLGAIFGMANDGFVAETGHEVIDTLFTRGGLQSMLYSVSIVFCAGAFGGVLEKTRCLETLTNALLAFAKGTGSLVLVTIFSCIFVNMVTGDQYLAIVIPGRMYKDEYAKRGLAPKNLSRCLEDSGTLTSPLVPWNSCAAYMSSTLGVSTFLYLPFCFLNYINPFVSIILGYTGITMEKLPAPDSNQEKTVTA